MTGEKYYRDSVFGVKKFRKGGKMSALIWLGVIIAEVIIGQIIGNPLWIWGIVIVTFGALFWDCLQHERAVDSKAVGAMSIYCFAWGGLVLAAVYAEHRFWIYDLTGYVFLYGFSFMFILLGIYMGIVKVIRCNTKVMAQYTGATACHSKSVTLYTPGFAYEYEGTTYKNTSGETFSKRKIEKMFQWGVTYPIYINPNNPASFLVRRRIGKSAVCMLVLGSILFLVPIFI